MGVAQEPQQPNKAARGPARKVIMLASLLLVLVAGVWLSYRYWISLRSLGDESTNIVFIGVDTPLWEQAEDGESTTGYASAFGQYGYKADAVFVGTIHPLRKSSHLLALPADLLVTLPDGSEGKLNAVFAAGGVPAVERVVEELLGIPVHYYVLIDYTGFTELVDAIGGVDVDVATPIRYYDKGKLVFELEEGVQRLLGSEALHYVRYRRETESDLGRLERQKELIMSLADELCQAARFTQLPKLARYMEELVDTNLRWEDGLRMATILLRQKALGIDVTTLPVRETETGYLPEPEAIEEVVRHLFHNPSWRKLRHW
ncbi:MAG: LCP family protein [Firmicutes bacterium]|nr:LCP family protein [Bacillota bacterium]